MRSFIICLAVACGVLAGGDSSVKTGAAAAHYGVPSYQAPPAYSAPPQYGAPSFNMPNFDVNYCSVHASFPLIGKKQRHGRREKRQAYGDAPAQDSYAPQYQSYGNTPSYGPSYIPRPRPFSRYACRHTAILSQASCNTCCQISSRIPGDQSPVVGFLMAFDPKITERKRLHDEEEDEVEDDDELADDDEKDEMDRALQCVCCTSQRKF